ncbi:alpha-tocopherol transfer protein-like [Styela clava]
MSGRYECKLSPELMKKAVAELNEPEDNDKRLAAIDKLRTRFEEEDNGLELIRSDDDFLLRFLRVKKFDEDRAMETLVNYHKQRNEWKELFDYVDDPTPFKDLISAGPLLPLRNGRAKDGTFVMIVRPGYGFQSKEDMLKFIAILILSLDKLLEQEEFQIHGMTVIEDMTHFGLTMALQMASVGKRMLHIVQEAMPIRVKSLNMVNEGLVFDTIYAVISAFMKEKMKERLMLHGSNFKTLHDKIDPAYLPFFLGGTGPDLNTDWWTNEILSSCGTGEDTAL